MKRYHFDSAGTGREVFESISAVSGGRSYYAPGASDLSGFYDTLREIMAGPEPYTLCTEHDITPGTLRVGAS